MWDMEIHLVLETTEPPDGILRVLPDGGRTANDGEYGEVRFAGWLGLLGALYNMTGGAAGPPLGDPEGTGTTS